MIQLLDFLGEWQVTRQIEDAYGQQRGVFEGQAGFQRDQEGLRYHEAGQLRMGGGVPMRAERVYLWRQAGAQIEVRFEDGRPFHLFATDTGARADHLCGDDLYKVQYDFADWPHWSAVWQVSGPRKSYEMTSHYTRC